MSRILLCGLCPLPFENTHQSYGPGIRTWQMAHSLAAAGHHVRLVAMRIDGTYEESLEIPDREEYCGVEIERLTTAEFFDPEIIKKHLDAAAPDAVVGATIYGSFVLAQQQPKVPFWADQFGHVMAEAQAKAHLEQANWPLQHFWNLLTPVLRSADRISVVSARQRWAAVGELGMVGRLSAETCGYEFTSVMPCALLPQIDDAPKPRRLLRGGALPEDAFVALWSGGYNVWSDVDTLFQAFELAMARDPSLHFVSTGGGIAGHDESTYARFEAAIAGSPHRQRYHLQGWVRAALVPSYQAEADLGVLCEIPMYEGRLGSKNRVVQWLGSGLPVLYNSVGDLGDLIDQHRLGLTFRVGDAEVMAERLLWASAHRAELGEMARRAEDYTRQELSFESTTAELVNWASAPSFAPDFATRGAVESPADYPPPPAPGEVEPESPQLDSESVGETSVLEETELQPVGAKRASAAPAWNRRTRSAEAHSTSAQALGFDVATEPPLSGIGRALRRIFSFS